MNKDVRAGSACQFAKIALTATLGLAITLTLFACEEKKAAQEAGGGTITDTRDGKTYKTVKIGTQVWMAENLDIEMGDSLCYYDDHKVRCQKYGRLYEWETAMKACPSGWHLPSNAEWIKLVDFVGGKGTAGKYLKATSGWNNNGNGEDKYGFSALPGGFCSGECGNDGIDGYWWSASDDSNGSAYYGMVSGSGDDVIYSGGDKSDSRSVRCIQN